MKEALSWIKGQQLCDTVVETDYLVMVQAIRNAGASISYFGLLRELEGRNVKVKFVKRSAYMVACFLAKSTYSIPDHIWPMCDNQPKFIYVLMNNLSH